jgi:hypothetical protein
MCAAGGVCLFGTPLVARIPNRRRGWTLMEISKLVEIDDYYIDPDVYVAEWQNTPRCLPAALSYAEKGWFVFPAPRGEKKSHKSAEHSGGRPWGKTTDPDEIRRDFARWPEANLCIATGRDSDIFVVEADTKEGHDVDGIAALRALEQQYGPLPDTLTAQSPSGSIHRYFRNPQDREVCNSTSQVARGVDVRGEGGMVVAPPSVKVSVGSYVWISNAEIADAPEWLIELATANSVSSADRIPSEHLEADLEHVGLALEVIPNDDLDYDNWNRVAMAAYRATGGAGFAAFDAWSQKSKKYNAADTIERWHKLSRSPPDRIGAGTLFFMANEVRLGWDNSYHAKIRGESVNYVDPAADEEMLAELAAAQRNGDLGNSAESKNDQSAAQASETKEQPKSDDKAKAQTKPSAKPSTAPVDLWNKFEPPPLPTGLLPSVIEQFAFEQGALMGADPAALAAGALVVCAAAVPDCVKLKVKRYGGWMESTRLWIGLVGDPSAKKTPIINQVAKQLVRLDAEMWRAYLRAKTEYDALNREEKRTRQPPRQARLRLDDTTMEAAQEVLRDSPDGVLCMRDELSGWFGSMDKYVGNRGGMADRSFWLQAYNGGTYAFNRITRGSGMIENLSVSVLGGIQPEPMRKVVEGTVDDGLIQRIVPIMVQRGAVGSDAPESKSAAAYDDLIVRLREMVKPFDDIEFEDAARKIRQELECKHNDLIACEAVSKKLAAHVGKYDGIFARLCLLWQCIESTDKEPEHFVTAATAQRVADFLHRFLLPHATAFYADIFGMSEDHDRLTSVAGYILAHKVSLLTNRVIQRGDRTMRKLGLRDTENICQQLSALGWVNRVSGARAGDPPHWNVNPEVHRRFEERARQEAERRSREREMIAAMLSPNPLRDNGDT